MFGELGQYCEQGQGGSRVESAVLISVPEERKGWGEAGKGQVLCSSNRCYARCFEGPDGHPAQVRLSRLQCLPC